jgi:YD repeat-containing protein
MKTFVSILVLFAPIVAIATPKWIPVHVGGIVIFIDISTETEPEQAQQQYDERGRLIRSRLPSGEYVEYFYDELGNVVRIERSSY